MAGLFLRTYSTTLDASTAGSTKVRISIRKSGTATFATGSDWSPASGDVKISKDGGAEANIGTLPAYSNGQWEFVLSGTELTAKNVHVRVSNAAVDDEDFNVETFGNSSAMYPTNYEDAVRLGMTALPNAAAAASGGLVVIGTTANTFKSDSSAQVTAASVQGNVTGSVASVTGNVGGNVVGSVASVTAGVTVTTNNDKTGYTVSTVSDKTGYSLTQAFPTNFSALAITAGGIAQADVQTIKTQAVTASAGVTFPASIASPTNITAGTITTVTNLTNAPTAGDFTATMKTSLSAATPAVTVSDKTGFALTSAYDAAKTAAQAGDAMALTTSERTSVAAAVWNALTSGLTTAGSIGKRLVDFVTTLVYAAAPSASDNATAVWASGTRTLTSSASLTDDQAQTMADLATMIQGSDTADAQFTTKALEEGPSGTSNITVTPISSTVSTGEVTGTSLIAYQNQTIVFSFGIADSNGDAVDLSTKTVAFYASHRSAQNSPVITRDTDGNGVTVTGTGHNTVNVSLGNTQLADIALYVYSLWNVTDDMPLAKGQLDVQAIPQEVA